MSKATPNLRVVIVNYRTGDLTIDCLRSMVDEVQSLRSEGTPVDVVVTDNASPDDSAARIGAAIEEAGWDWAQLCPLPENGGFAYGNNEAIRPALQSGSPPDYVLLLNPDTLVRPGAFRELLTFMEAHPDVGIAGSRLEFRDGTPQPSAFRFPTLLSELDNGAKLGLLTRLLSRRVVAPPPPDGACRTDWVSGACLMVRRAVFSAIGLLDEGYFMYYEETDFCRHAAEVGWPCWYVPSSRVVHLIGQSSGVTDVKKRRPAYWFESRSRYFRKHHGRVAKGFIDAAWAAAYASYRVRRFIQRKPDTDPPHLLRDFLRHNLRRGMRAA